MSSARLAARTATNLPAARIPLVGRDAERRSLADQTRSAPGRLITVTGPGGVGKTSLALAVARDVIPDFKHGVWLADLSALASPEHVAQAIARAVGVREGGRNITAALIAFLRDRQLLLVLDNCEHLLHVCAHLANVLLDQSPELTLLATSREALRIGGEATYPLQPLPIPADVAAESDVAALAGCASVAFFVDRAQAVRPDFALTAENAPIVAEICIRLDGMPLALELAAKRLSGLTLRRIAEGLRGSFDLLIGKERTRPERQRTLRAAVEWSYELLSDPEQRVFRRLGAMAGWWSIDAAELVCGGDGVDARAVSDVLASLAEKSLIVLEQSDNEACYRFLAPLHDYAQGQLAASGESQRTRDNHRAFFVVRAEQARAEMHRAQQAAWMLRLDRELDNLRVAIRTAHQREDGESALRLAGALWWYLWVRGHLREGIRWLGPALARHDVSDYARLAGLGAAAMLFGAVGQSEQATAYANEMADLAHRLGNVAEVSRATTMLGMEALRGGNREAAREFFERALADALTAENAMLIGNARVNLGQVLPPENAPQAEQLFQEGLAQFEGEGDAWGIAYAADNIGCLLRARGEHAQAAQYSARAVQLLTSLGDRFYLIFAIENLARACADADRSEAATRLLGAAHALRQATGALLSPGVREDYERYVAAVKSDLGGPAFEDAWTAGMRLSLDALADEANPKRASNTSIDECELGGPGGVLTPRERQVARLIAVGRSNRQIAKELAIAVGTAGIHVEHILGKLDMRSRHQVGDWARARGLVAD